MVAQAFAPGTMQGLSAALTTNTTLFGLIVDIPKAPEMMRKAISTLHSGTTDGVETFIAGNIITPGELQITLQFSTQLDYMALFLSGACDTLTITFPKRITTCGQALPTSAATFASSVVWTALGPQWKFDDLAVITLTFQMSGKPTWVAAVV